MEPMLPNVEISANPIGPQLHTPAAAPKNDPNILPPIFLFEDLKIFIRKMFMGKTNADKPEIIRINENPSSVPLGI